MLRLYVYVQITVGASAKSGGWPVCVSEWVVCGPPYHLSRSARNGGYRLSWLSHRGARAKCTVQVVRHGSPRTCCQVVAQSTTEATLLLRAALLACSKLRCGCNWISERTACNDPCCQVVAQSTTEATVLLRAVANLCPCGVLWLRGLNSCRLLRDCKRSVSWK